MRRWNKKQINENNKKSKKGLSTPNLPAIKPSILKSNLKYAGFKEERQKCLEFFDSVCKEASLETNREIFPLVDLPEAKSENDSVSPKRVTFNVESSEKKRYRRMMAAMKKQRMMVMRAKKRALSTLVDRRSVYAGLIKRERLSGIKTLINAKV